MSDNVPSQQPSDPIASDAVINVTFPVNDDVIRRAVKAGMRVGRGRWRRLFAKAYGVLVIAFSLYLLATNAPVILWSFFLILGVFLVSFPYLIAWMALRKTQQHLVRCGVTETSYEFGPDYFESRNSVGSGRSKYLAPTKVVVSDGFLVLLSHNAYGFLPIASLQNEQIGLILSRFKNTGVKVEVR